jgi:hypothetical protein
MSTKRAKEPGGVASEFPLVGELVVEGLLPAIRVPATMRRPKNLAGAPSNSKLVRLAFMVVVLSFVRRNSYLHFLDLLGGHEA